MRIFPLMTSIILLGCTAALADGPIDPSWDRPKQDGRCIGAPDGDDMDLLEQACLHQIGGMAERHGPGPQVKFRNGLTKVYLNEDAKCQSDEAEGCIKYRLTGYFPKHDLIPVSYTHLDVYKTKVYLNEDAKCQSDEAEGCIKYRLTGYFPKHDLILIEVGYWEGVSWLLVRADTGSASDIVAPPRYSPSERWLVSVASSVGPSGPPNGIDIVPAISDPSIGEWHYRVPDEDPWLYEFAGWDGDDRVKLTATSTEGPRDTSPPPSRAATGRGNSTHTEIEGMPLTQNVRLRT